MRSTLLPLLVVVGCMTGSGTRPKESVDRGEALYMRHCSACHGESGDAETAVAELLRPRPNAFRQGVFKLVSTKNGIPTDHDLVEMLRRGMPGSTMMSYGFLPEGDLEALAQHVRRLAIEGRANSLQRAAAITGRPLEAEHALELAARELAPGEVIETGDPVALDDATLAEGERLYRQHCASCHGADGRGLPGTAEWPTDNTWLWPRDFTAGYLRGGATHRDLALRIRAGMPGAHMPPTALDRAETQALVAFVQGLIPAAARDHHVQWRRTVRVPRVAALPADDDAQAFVALERVRLPLAPIWWRADSVDEVHCTAVHDGRTLLLRLEWQDTTRDDRPRPGAVHGDGVAVQFAAHDDPPLLAMGSSDHPVDAWRWRAFDAKNVAGLVDLLQAHRGLDVPAIDVSPPRAGESLRLRGIDSVGAASGSGAPVAVDASFADGRWTVTFRRALGAGAGGSEPTVGRNVPFAVAVWDGTTDPRPTHKAISAWHRIELLP